MPRAGPKSRYMNLKSEFLRRLELYKGNITLLISRLHYSVHLYGYCHKQFGGSYIKMLNKYKALLNIALRYNLSE